MRSLAWVHQKVLDRWYSIRSRWSGNAARRKNSTLPSVGARGEEMAAAFLRRQGMIILFQGYRSPLGEIDIVAVDQADRKRRTIVFVEVKTWTSPGVGGPSDAVDDRKQERLTRLALEFLKRHHLLESRARLDVIQVILNPLSIRHFPNAFEAIGKYQWFS